MEEKNRFSGLLEQLMAAAELKNYTLAQELKYDVSYISKWVSGRMIPAEKTEKKVLEGISHCIVKYASDEGLQRLLRDYQVKAEELEFAIYDNLKAEYDYVRELQKNADANVTPKTAYFPKLAMPQYIAKMRHPVLRRVNSLEIMAAMDLMAMDREHRLQIVEIENGRLSDQHQFPDVHFSMLINLEIGELDYIYDTIFLINTLTNFLHIDFNLYGSSQAYGRVIFTVKDDFAIAGMLMNKNECVSVNVSEDSDSCNTLYYSVKDMCRRENLLFRRTTIDELLEKNDYLHSLLSPNLRWLMGHMTEHFLPNDLFEELLEQSGVSAGRREELRTLHNLTNRIMEKTHVQLMVYEAAFSNLAISDELDFYSRKVSITPEQKLRYMEHLLTLYQEKPNLEIKLIYGQFTTDFQYIDKPCIFLADTRSYLRLSNNNGQSHLVLINRADIQSMFDRFFQEIWEKREDVVVSDRAAITEYIQHVKQGVYLLSSLE